MPPEKSTTYECRRGLPQQGMRRVISLTINDLNRLSSSDLPYRQLRKYARTQRMMSPGDLPYRQLRKGAIEWQQPAVGDLPYRQLRNAGGQGISVGLCDLPYRQLRKTTASTLARVSL